MTGYDYYFPLRSNIFRKSSRFSIRCMPELWFLMIDSLISNDIYFDFSPPVEIFGKFIIFYFCFGNVFVYSWMWWHSFICLGEPSYLIINYINFKMPSCNLITLTEICNKLECLFNVIYYKPPVKGVGFRVPSTAIILSEL